MFSSLRLYNYDLIDNKKIIRHVLYKSDKLNKEDFTKQILDKDITGFKVIEFSDLLNSLSYN